MSKSRFPAAVVAVFSSICLTAVAWAAEPRPEAVKLAKVTAPFVTPDTGLIAHLDLVRLDLTKFGEEVIAEAKGPAEIKKYVNLGLGAFGIQQARLADAGVLEVVAVGGGKVDDEARMKGSASVVLLVRVQKGKKTEDIVAMVQGLIPGPDAAVLAKHWVAGDWIAFSATDPKEIAKASELKPVKELSALFEAMLARGAGAHVAFAPQAELKKSMLAFMKKGEDKLAQAPDHIPTEIRQIPKLGTMTLNGNGVILSIVAEPEPKIALSAAMADATTAQSGQKILKDALAILPNAPEFQNQKETIEAIAGVLKPTVSENRVSIELGSQDESLLKFASSGMDMAQGLLGKVAGAAKAAGVTNNLKQLALGMHNHHDVFNGFPAASARYPDGKGKWSWRIRMLPFVEENALYNKLDVRKAPDDAENADVLNDAKVPDVFRHPAFPGDPPGTTRFAVPRLKEGGFEGDKGLKIFNITDGTSLTIMLVVLDKPVSWIDGGDWEVAADDPTNGLLVEDGMITVALFDGSIQKIKADDKDRIRKMLTIAGGERVE